VKLSKGAPDARAARPIGYHSGDRRHRIVDPRPAQLTGDAREPRREQEGLDPAMAPRDYVGELEKHARVALHRAADVAQQHERTRLGAAP
jgi:hypothetical protein